MKKIFTLILLLSTSLSFAREGQIVFPRESDINNKDRCIVVTKPCSFDINEKCTQKFCGIHLKQNTLNQFVMQYQLIGKKFPSIFELETFLKNNLPAELSNMSLNFVNKAGGGKKDFHPNRINMYIDSKEYIYKFVIG